MADYKGMTIGYVSKIWGDDYTILDFLYAGGSAIICYEDRRCPFYFHIAATDVPESCNGDEVLTDIEIYNRDEFHP